MTVGRTSLALGTNNEDSILLNFFPSGVLAVGLFAENPYPMHTTNGRSGLIKGSLSISFTCLNDN